jgi:hypothetical protein
MFLALFEYLSQVFQYNVTGRIVNRKTKQKMNEVQRDDRFFISYLGFYVCVSFFLLLLAHQLYSTYPAGAWVSGIIGIWLLVGVGRWYFASIVGARTGLA